MNIPVNYLLVLAKSQPFGMQGKTVLTGWMSGRQVLERRYGQRAECESSLRC